MTRTLGLGLTMAAAQMFLSACQTVTPDDLSRVESQVTDLSTRLDAAEARAAQADAAAARCTQTCEANAERVERMYQQSLRK